MASHSSHPSAQQSSPLRLLLMSTPVGPLGSGLGGGVELTLKNIAQALHQRGHQIQIVAPRGSVLQDLPGVPLVEIDGTLQPTAQNHDRHTPALIPKQAVLAEMWAYARQVQSEFDVLVNFAYDWLPFYLSDWLDCPVAHLVSMGSLTDVMDGAIAKTLDAFPGTIGVHSQAQAETFAFGDRCRCLGNGFDLSQYQFQPDSDPILAWVGRIAPEKGLEDAVAAAQQINMPLHIFGAISDEAYWQHIQDTYPHAPIHYQGFLSTQELQAKLGRCRGMVMTPKWVEAFGNVAIEAIACGVPVVAYRRGGPAEIVEPGVTGWLVEPDSVSGLIKAIARLDTIDRQACRHHAEQHYSLDAMGQRVEAWLNDIRVTHS
ncbi:MAG: glycosyltransferase family 4 protein [Elainellaceae cyanobacterium]